MTRRTRILLVFLLLGAFGCAALKKSPFYEGPFEAGKRYVTDAPVSVWVGDEPFESVSVWVGDEIFEPGARTGEGAASPVRAIRDPVVLVPGTPVEFVRKDSPYLVFLVKSGEHKGRYAWIYQHGQEVNRLSAVPLP
jgi:hypothetical protein